MDKNHKEGSADQGEQVENCELLWVKDPVAQMWRQVR